MEKSRVKYKVLILDDEAQIRRLLRMTLESNDYKVFEAGSSKERRQPEGRRHLSEHRLQTGLRLDPEKRKGRRQRRFRARRRPGRAEERDGRTNRP